MKNKQELPLSECAAIPLTRGAKMLGIALSHAYTLIAAGELRTFKIGRRRMVAPAALSAYVERKEAEAGGKRAKR